VVPLVKGEYRPRPIGPTAAQSYVDKRIGNIDIVVHAQQQVVNLCVDKSCLCELNIT